MLLNKSTFLAALLACFTFIAGVATAAPELSAGTRTSEYSLGKKNLALDGYDPVAYFQNGPREGSKKLSYTYKGVVYRFASAANLNKFKAAPADYEPQFGGWCAWAMYDGGRNVEPDPENYKIIEGKLYLFYKGFFGDTQKLWNKEAKKKGQAALISTAAGNWSKQVR